MGTRISERARHAAFSIALAVSARAAHDCVDGWLRTSARTWAGSTSPRCSCEVVNPRCWSSPGLTGRTEASGRPHIGPAPGEAGPAPCSNAQHLTAPAVTED